jgi:hypothetical protein
MGPTTPPSPPWFKRSVTYLVGFPVLALVVLGVGFWLNEQEQRRVKREYQACLDRCAKILPLGFQRPPAPAGAPFDPDRYLCEHQEKLPQYRTWGDGCEEEYGTDYEWLGKVGALLIGLVWAAFVGWLLVLAMIRSVVRAVNDGRKRP